MTTYSVVRDNLTDPSISQRYLIVKSASGINSVVAITNDQTEALAWVAKLNA